jgi:hypothetical protein
VWDVGTGACLRVLEGHHKGAHGVAIAADGHVLHFRNQGLDGAIDCVDSI